MAESGSDRQKIGSGGRFTSCESAARRVAGLGRAVLATCAVVTTSTLPLNRAMAADGPPTPPAHEVRAHVFAEPPRVDGDLSDWDGLPEACSGQLAEAWQALPARREAWGGPEDASARFRAGVDREALYFAVSVTDDWAFHPGRPWWHGDSLELFLDADWDGRGPRSERYTEGCWQIFLMPRNPELAWGVVYRGERAWFDDAGLEGVQIAYREREHGYDLEARLPLRNFGLDPARERRLGFALALNDADEAPRTPGSYLSWNGGFDLYRVPAHFGTLVLPARSPAVAPEPAPSEGVPWSLLALALFGLLVVALSGPGSRFLAGVGARPKGIALALVGVLAVIFALDDHGVHRRAGAEARASLEALAARARSIAEAAEEAGALPPRGAARRAALEALLRGQRVPARQRAADQAFVVPAVPVTSNEPRHRIDLGIPRTLWFDRPVPGASLTAEIELPATPGGASAAVADILLGHFVPAGAHAASPPAPLALVVPGRGSRRRTAILALPRPGPWHGFAWTPTPAAQGARLLDLAVPGADGGEGPARLLSSEETEDGVPVLGGPGGPDLSAPLPRGATLRFVLPYLKDADRLWLVLNAPEAFPHALGDAVAVRLSVSYDAGPATEAALRNAEHLVAEQLPPGIPRPPDGASRVAWRWRDGLGALHTLDAVSVPLDPTRRARRLSLENLGGAGDLRVRAITVLRSRPLPADAALGLAPPGGDGIDSLFVPSPDPAFAFHLDAPRGGVSAEFDVGPAASPIVLTLSAPLPPSVAAKRARTAVALLACLAIAVFLLVLLAADALERLRRLWWRLAFAVLAAALIPLVATMALVDRSTAERLEAEHAARARAQIAALRRTLEARLRQAGEAADRLASQLAREAGVEEPGRVARLVRLYRSGASAHTEGMVLVTGPDRPPVRVPPDPPAAPFAGPHYLVAHAHEPGFHVSPWDGLLLVNDAQRGEDLGRVRVSLGVRVDGWFLLQAGGPFDGDAAVAILDAGGPVLAVAGDAEAAAFGEALRHLRPPGKPGERVIPAVRAERGPARIAVMTPLETRSARGAWLAVGLDRRGIEAAIRGQREQLLWLALFGLLLVAGVAGLTARRVSEPVRDLVRVTDAVRRGEWDVEMPPARADEVGDLTVAFDQMRRDLEHRVGDLDLLRRAQDALSGSLDYAHRAQTVVGIFRERFAPDAALLLDATSGDAPVAVAAEWGRRTALDDRPFATAPDGWLRAALRGEGPLVLGASPADPRIAAEGGRGERLVEGRPAWLAMPLLASGEVTGLVVLAYDDPGRVPRGEGLRLLGPLGGVCGLALGNARLYRLAALDDVTRLPGATAFEAALRAEVERAVGGGAPVTVLRVGFDHLDHVFLRRGVRTGHALQRALAEALRAVAGTRSQLGRLREDEFGVRLVGASREEAAARAETIRARLAAVELPPDEGGEAVRTAVTVGIARCPEDAASLEFLMDAAGRALAAARGEGGDRVEDAARLQAALVDVPPFEEGAVFRSERMVRVVEAARRAARTDSSVLITGETGTGKEVIANLVHRRSMRTEHPFVTVNCAAFPETLLESELFGHERGAFTGAERRREGRFELADGGTLFLDEIGEMAPSAQVKLLRVLQERQFTRLGGTRPVKVSVRIVAATNQDLEAAVATGRFREDLYYRLNVIRLEVPPLRERREEIPLLVGQFLQDARRRAGQGPARLTTAAMDLLYRHPWPGNVRELKNVIERCAVLCEADAAGPEHLQLDAPRPPLPLSARGAPGDELNHRQRRLLDHLARHGRCTNREYQDMAETSARTGLRDLQDLIDRGLLVREGKRRGAVYRLP